MQMDWNRSVVLLIYQQLQLTDLSNSRKYHNTLEKVFAQKTEAD